MHQYIAAVGYFVMIFLAWLMSSHRRRFPWRVVLGGTILQVTFAVLTIKTKPGRIFFDKAGMCFNTLMDFVDEGNVRVLAITFATTISHSKSCPRSSFFQP